MSVWPSTTGLGMPTTPAKPCVSSRHSVKRPPTTSAKPRVIRAKYQVESRKAGSAMTAPTAAAATMASSAAGQNDH